MEVDHAESAGRVRGFASAPPLGRADRRHQMFFVNRRPVKDKTIGAALRQAYRGILEKDLSPEAYLFFEIPPGEVDVNVHPSKTEIRFRRSSDVFQLVLRAVERARLKSGGLVEVAPVFSPAARPESPRSRWGSESRSPWERRPQPSNCRHGILSARENGAGGIRPPRPGTVCGCLHRRRGRRRAPGR